MTSRQSRRLSRIIAEGGSQLSLILGREATESLESIQAQTGQTKTQVLEMLLIEAAKAVRKDSSPA